MSADVRTVLAYGGSNGSPLFQTILNSAEGVFRFKTRDDNGSVDITASIPIPASGSVNSYWRSVTLYVSGWSGGTTELSNFRYYQDNAAMSTGTSGMAATSNSYIKATGTEGTSGAVWTATTRTSWKDYTYESPLAVDSGVCMSYPNTGAFSKFLVLQMLIASTASPGPTNKTTHYLMYDEV